MIQLTPEQMTAHDTIIEAIRDGKNQVLVLKGPAGTGKTTLMQKIGQTAEQTLGRRVVQAAPTGKASFNLTKKTGKPTSTVHRLLYGEVVSSSWFPREVDWDALESHWHPLVEEALTVDRRYIPTGDVDFDSRKLEYIDRADAAHHDYKHRFWSPTSDEDPEHELKFGAPRYKIKPRDLVIVDEASMVGETLHAEILEQLPDSAVLLYVGDHEQLPPVSEDWGPEFTFPTAELTKIHRQAEGNPIIQVATGIRCGMPFPREERPPHFKRKTAGLRSIVDWLVGLHRAGEDYVALCYTNRVRGAVNREVRKRLRHQGSLAVGDRVKIALNNKKHARMNGELVWVTGITEVDGELVVTVRSDSDERQTTAKVVPELIGLNQKAFFDFCRANGIHRRQRDKYLHLDYGYALTVHSSQGSEFDYVGYVRETATKRLWERDAETARRLEYTAATRAAHQLQVFDYNGRN